MSNYKEFAYKNIKELVEEGLKILNSMSDNNFYGSAGYSTPLFVQDNDAFQKWSDYSQKIIEISTKEIDTSILLNYLRLLISLQTNNTISAKKKIMDCLKFLIDVLEIMSRR